MPSPLPGMDPWLESHAWRSIHARLTTYSADQLMADLPGDLCARVEETLVVDMPDERRRWIAPDVTVSRRPDGGRPSARRRNAAGDEPGGGIAVLEPDVSDEPATAEEGLLGDVTPVLLSFPFDQPWTHRTIEIRTLGGNSRVITAIEFLSPVNKRPGPGRDQFLRKREELLSAGVNIVEIDLLRAGERTLPVGSCRVPADLQSPYFAAVVRGRVPHRVEAYPIPLRAPLPKISIPLRKGEKDVPLVLQPALDRAYDMGRHGLGTDYDSPPDPPLSDEDAAWARQLIKSAREAASPPPPAAVASVTI